MKKVLLVLSFAFLLFSSHAQNVGIGTTTPQSKLHLHSATTSSSELLISNNITTDAFGRGASFRMLGGNLFLANQEVGGLISMSTNGTERMTILNSGLVGIGTNTPATTLEVKSSNSTPMKVGGLTGMYMSLFENNIYRGYLGSYSGNDEDVDFGTGGGNTTGKLHLTIQASPKLTIHPNGGVSVGNVNLPNYSFMYIENNNSLKDIGLYVQNNKNTGQAEGVTGSIFSPVGSGIHGMAYDATLTTSGFETGRYGVLGSIADSGTAVGAFSLAGTAFRGKANNPLGTALYTTGKIKMDGIGEGTGKVLTSDASGNAIWKKLQSDSTFYRSNDTIYSYPNAQIRIGENNNHFITGFLGADSKVLLMDTTLTTFGHNLQSVRINKNHGGFSSYFVNGDINSFTDFRDNNYDLANAFAGGIFDLQTRTQMPGTAPAYGILTRGYSYACGAAGGYFLAHSADSNRLSPEESFFADVNTYGVRSQAGGTGLMNKSSVYGVFARTDSGGIGRKYAGYFEVNGNGLGADTALKWAGFFNGNVAYTGSLSFTSDERLKKNIHPLDNALSLIGQLRPAQYEYNKAMAPQMQMPKGTQFGLLAGEVEKVLPQLVSTNVIPAGYKLKEDGKSELISQEFTYKGINYIELIPLLIKGMQEQQKLIEQLQGKIENLTKKP